MGFIALLSSPNDFALLPISSENVLDSLLRFREHVSLLQYRHLGCSHGSGSLVRLKTYIQC